MGDEVPTPEPSQTSTNLGAEAAKTGSPQPDPSAPAPNALPKPRRTARLTLELEADDPEELSRAVRRALSRLQVGLAEWREATDLTDGHYQLSVVEGALRGRRHVEAVEAWREGKKYSPPRTLRRRG